MSLRTLFALFALSTLAAACDDPGDCAHGPTELGDVSLTAVAGAPFEAFIAFPEEAVGSFHFLSADGAPAALTLRLSEAGVTLRGTFAASGSYTFEVGVEAEAGEVCAAWGSYAVTLTVEE